MSVFVIYMKDGAKMMRPILKKEDYLALRDGGSQKSNLQRIRAGEEKLKNELVQMVYSCLPNEDGSLKGSKRLSATVGMDVDHIPREEMEAVKTRILAKKDEVGLLMFEESARGEGYHLVFRRRPELSQEENLAWASEVLEITFDKGAKDITRVFFTTTSDQLIFLDDAIFEVEEVEEVIDDRPNVHTAESNAPTSTKLSKDYDGLPYADIIKKWWDMYNDGKEPVEKNRDSLTYELALNLRHICGFNRDLMGEVIPCYDRFPQTQKMKCIDSALAAKRTQMPERLKDVLFEVRRDRMNGANNLDNDLKSLDDAVQEDDCFYYKRLPTMPQGVKDSIDAVGPALTMPVVMAICPVIGMLASGVRLEVHGTTKSLNLISYIAGDFASGKGSLDPVIDAWINEVALQDQIYQDQEDEWRAKKLLAKNQKNQPEQPKFPVRYLTLNNTVANLAERLANTGGKHAFSFTPEADTVAQKWKSSINDFSVMLRQSYDGTRFDREARSAEAVNVHIKQLLWNVVMCGTPDTLYRVVNNYTDGFQSRIALARTPDNTYTPLGDTLYVLTDRQAERIHQVAHLLMTMQGDVVLSKLEQKSREWVENVRLEAIKSDDRIMARQRFRTCVTAARMTCCLMLCRVCEQLIQKHGYNGAEKVLKAQPDLWKTMLQKAQTPQLLDAYDVIADYLIETALYFFRERIENAFKSRDYAGNNDRRRIGKNDSIFARLDVDFSFECAMQHSIGVKGSGVTGNSVRQMLKNWKKQGLIVQTERGKYHKVQEVGH